VIATHPANAPRSKESSRAYLARGQEEVFIAAYGTYHYAYGSQSWSRNPLFVRFSGFAVWVQSTSNLELTRSVAVYSLAVIVIFLIVTSFVAWTKTPRSSSVTDLH
jgi:hypothetical protein